MDGPYPIPALWPKVLREGLERYNRKYCSYGRQKPVELIPTREEVNHIPSPKVVEHITERVTTAILKALKGAQPWGRAAHTLTGRTVAVYLRTPRIKGLPGSFYRDEDIGYIEVRPGDPERMLWTFLHECVHVLKHWDTIPPSNIHELPAEGILVTAAHYEKHRQDPEELEADEQAAEWYELAYTLAPEASIEERLEHLIQHIKEADIE